MLEKLLKKSSTSLDIRERQIKTTLRLYFTPDIVAKVKKTNNSSCLLRCSEMESLLIDGARSDLYRHYGSNAVGPQETENQSTSSPALPLWRIYPKDSTSYHR